MARRSRSAGVRHPGRWALVNALGTVAGIVMLVLGARGASPPLQVPGLFAVLLCPMFLAYYLGRVRTFRGLRSGRTAIARWTVPAEEFRAFCERENAVPPGSIAVNYYRPPDEVSEAGVEVIFSDRGVLIGEGWFPLSLAGGRRLQGVRYLADDPPAIAFDTLLSTTVRTSSATVATRHSAQTLRVPVARAARAQAGRVVDHFEARLLVRRH